VRLGYGCARPSSANGLRAVSNDRCLAPGCRRTVTWIEDLADGGVTSW
jgi:hypothetical protein